MNKKLAIKVSNLNKCYRIGVNENTHDSFLRSALSFLKSPLENYRRYRSLYTFDDVPNLDANQDHPSDIIWALKDISFEVEKGEVVGLIGRNGAGKSTLLKILCRITPPTTGHARVRGRISSLLEVGTGFHPDLTGRENIYLNGTILGMTKTEIDSKLDNIIDFSGVEKFIDTPVKRYSSGMRIRLGFSVAAHLEPEILLVDEVLAVGDIAFQKKCIGKMQDVSQEGRTVVFVSHNLPTIQSLCSRGILLENGGIVTDGDIKSTIDQYLLSLETLAESKSLEERTDRRGGDQFRFTQVDFLKPIDMSPKNAIVSGEPVLLAITYRNTGKTELKGAVLSIAFFNSIGDMIFKCDNDSVGKTVHIEPGEGSFYVKIPRFPLNCGRYSYNLLAHVNWNVLDQVKPAGYFDVEPGNFYGTGKVPAPVRQMVLVDYEWFDGEALNAIST